MKKINSLPLLLLILSVIIFFKPFFTQGQLPIPSDTIIGLYHPFRDLYAEQYPNGIPYKNFLITDPVRQQYPWRFSATENIAHSSLPVWNPYTMAGTPLLANFQTAAFYPLNIIYLLLPFATGWSLQIVLQPLLAGIFIYLYLRHLKLSQGAAGFGGIIFAFCGFSTAWLEWNTLVQSALWLPLIMLAIDKLGVSGNKFAWSLMYVFSLCAAFFAGHIQIFIYVYLFSTMYFFARWFQKKRNSKILFLYLLLNSLFLLLTAVQWIPTLQFINLSARGVDQIYGWQQPGWFIPWQHLIQFIAPDFFGNPTTLNYWGEWNYGEFVGYIGIFPLIMAFFALYNRQDKKTLFFGVFFFLSLIFSLPTIFAELPYKLDIPLLSTSQPTRLLFIADFSLAVLAALGLDFFLKTAKKWKVFYSLGIIGIILIGLWIAVLYGHKLYPDFQIDHLLVAKRNLYIPTFFFVTASVILAVWVLFTTVRRFEKMLDKQILAPLLLLFLLSLTIFDLLRFSQKFTPFTNNAYLYPATKSLSFLQDQKGQFRIMATDSRILPPNFSVMYQLQSIDGYDPLYIRRYGEFVTAIGRDKPDIRPPFGFNRIITPQKFDSPFIDLLGVQYVLSLANINSPKLEKVFSEGETKIYKNKNTFPRAFFVQKLEIAHNKNEAIQKLFREKDNLTTYAVVENTQGFSSKTLSRGTAKIETYSGDSVEIATKNDADGFLVLTDTYYPSWKVSICTAEGYNCTKSIIYPTDYVFRGVFVPAGEHRIKFNISLL